MKQWQKKKYDKIEYEIHKCESFNLSTMGNERHMVSLSLSFSHIRISHIHYLRYIKLVG